MKRKTAKLIITILLVAILVLCAAAMLLPAFVPAAGKWLGAAVVILLIPFTGVILTFKCSRCGKPIRPYFQKYCAYCGEKIEWE